MKYFLILFGVWVVSTIGAYFFALAAIRLDEFKTVWNVLLKEDRLLMILLLIGGPAALGACIGVYLEARIRHADTPKVEPYKGPICKFCKQPLDHRSYWNAPEGSFCGVGHYEAWRSKQ